MHDAILIYVAIVVGLGVAHLHAINAVLQCLKEIKGILERTEKRP